MGDFDNQGWDPSGVNDPEYNQYFFNLQNTPEEAQNVKPYTEWKVEKDRAELNAAYDADPIQFWVDNGNYAPPDTAPARIINDYRGKEVAFLDAQDRIIKWRPTYDTNDWKDVTDLGRPTGFTFPGFQNAPISGAMNIVPSGTFEEMAVVSENPGIQGIAINEKEAYQFPWKTVIGTLSVPLTAGMLSGVALAGGSTILQSAASAWGVSTTTAGMLIGGGIGAASGAVTGGGKGALIGGITGMVSGYMAGAAQLPADVAQSYPIVMQKNLEAMPLDGVEKIAEQISSGAVDFANLPTPEALNSFTNYVSNTGQMSDAGAAWFMGGGTADPNAYMTAGEIASIAPYKNTLTGNALEIYNQSIANIPLGGGSALERLATGTTQAGDESLLTQIFGDTTLSDIVTGVGIAGALGGAEFLGGGQDVPDSGFLTPDELAEQVSKIPSAMPDYLAQAQNQGAGGTGAGGVPITGAATPLFPQFTLPTEGPFYGAGRFGEPGQFTNFYAGQQAGATSPYGVTQYTPPPSTFQPQAPVPGQTTIPGTDIQLNPSLINPIFENPPIGNVNMMYTPDASGQLYYERGSVNDLFNRLLLRDPTADELAWATDALSRGATATDIGEAIRSSTEYRSQGFLDRSFGGQAAPSDVDWAAMLSSPMSGARIPEVKAQMVTDALRGILGNVNPSIDLVYDIWGRIPSSAANWQEVVANVQRAYANSAYRGGEQSQGQQRAGALATQFQQNPQMTIGELQDYYSGVYGSTPRQEQPLTSMQIGGTDQAYQFIPQEIRQAYQDYLGRPIGSAGAEWVSGSLRSGGAINDIIAAIQSSPEAQAYTPPPAQVARPLMGGGAAPSTPAQITAPAPAPAITAPALSPIEQAYVDSLGRTPDAAGLQYWNNAVASGANINDVIAAIQSSPEALARR